jgi:hypothetical protein
MPNDSGTRTAPFDPAASAAAVALAIVVFNAAAHPWAPTPPWSDAALNEWIIWFAALYLVLVAGAAAAERTGTLARHVRRPLDALGRTSRPR